MPKEGSEFYTERMYMKKAIIIVVAALLVLSGLTVTVLYYIGDRMVDSVMDSEIDSLLEEQPSSGTDASGTGTSGTGGTQSQTPNTELPPGLSEITPTGGDKLSEARDQKDGDKPAGDGSPNKAGDPDHTGAANNNEAGLPNSNEKNSDAKGKDSGSDEQKDEKKPEEKVQYTVEVMKEVKEKVSATEKVSAAALLVKRLSSADIKELQSMLPGGVDTAEKKRAMEIVYQKFTQDEIKAIKDLYGKYMD